MHTFYFRRLGLLEEASETTTATQSGGTTAATPPAAKPPEAGAAATTTSPPADAAAKPGIIDRALGLMRDKGTLNAEITALKSERDGLKTENVTLKAQIADLQSKVTAYQANEARLSAALDTAEKQNKDVAAEVTHQLATTGLPENQLPSKAAITATADNIDDLAAQVGAEKDPKKKGELALKLKAARAKQSNKQGTGAN